MVSSLPSDLVPQKCNDGDIPTVDHESFSFSPEASTVCDTRSVTQRLASNEAIHVLQLVTIIVLPYFSVGLAAPLPSVWIHDSHAST